MPYFAANPSEFWRRWHISLSTWLRDYLYIPLGGNRLGSFGTFRNLVLTMLLGGLWHGAAWHYVAWGAYHGLLLIGHRLLQPLLSRIQPEGRCLALGWRWLRVACFFVLTLFGWGLFRIEDLGRLPEVISNAWQPWAWNARVLMLTLVIFCAPIVLLDALQEWRKDLMAIKKLWGPVRLAIYLFMFACIVMSSSRENHAFIYFQF
jgi:D-alanyl-lipoteichoic acid acyltransferase DltB (MBOAT superfamily)